MLTPTEKRIRAITYHGKKIGDCSWLFVVDNQTYELCLGYGGLDPRNNKLPKLSGVLYGGICEGIIRQNKEEIDTWKVNEDGTIIGPKWLQNLPSQYRYKQTINDIDYYVSQDAFLQCQLGKGRSSYKTQQQSENFGSVAIYYCGINIGNGYKKRLRLIDGDTTTIIAKQFS